MRAAAVRRGNEMATFLIVVGAILAVSGLAAVLGGAPVFALGFDNTLILAGTVGLVGGLMLVGLGRILAALVDLGLRVDRPAQPTAATSFEPAASADNGVPRPAQPRQPARPAYPSEFAPTPAPASAATAGDGWAGRNAGEPAGFESPAAERPVAERTLPERPTRERQSQDKLGQERLGQERQPLDRPPPAERTAKDRFGSERIAQERPTHERPSTQERPAPERSSAERAGRDLPAGATARDKVRPARLQPDLMRIPPLRAPEAEAASAAAPPAAPERPAPPAAEAEPARAIQQPTAPAPRPAAASRLDPFRAAWQKAWDPNWTSDLTAEKRAAAEAPSAAPEPNAPPVPAFSDPASSQILKAGVIGGMAYTLYADGSIEADLPEGLIRFASVQALREHVERAEAGPHASGEEDGANRS
ncbi:hypothetical protein [Blastochloris viridis]|nr:hypothetical protein [Blastochloris viridis]